MTTVFGGSRSVKDFALLFWTWECSRLQKYVLKVNFCSCVGLVIYDCRVTFTLVKTFTRRRRWWCSNIRFNFALGFESFRLPVWPEIGLAAEFRNLNDHFRPRRVHFRFSHFSLDDRFESLRKRAAHVGGIGEVQLWKIGRVSFRFRRRRRVRKLWQRDESVADEIWKYCIYF